MGNMRSWWENDLNTEDRHTIMGDKSWSDIGENTDEGIKKRQAWLWKAYKKNKNRKKYVEVK